MFGLNKDLQRIAVGLFLVGRSERERPPPCSVPLGQHVGGRYARSDGQEGSSNARRDREGCASRPGGRSYREGCFLVEHVGGRFARSDLQEKDITKKQLENRSHYLLSYRQKHT